MLLPSAEVSGWNIFSQPCLTVVRGSPGQGKSDVALLFKFRFPPSRVKFRACDFVKLIVTADDCTGEVWRRGIRKDIVQLEGIRETAQYLSHYCKRERITPEEVILETESDLPRERAKAARRTCGRLRQRFKK